MKLDAFSCSEAELAKYGFSFMHSDNEPDVDRRVSNYVLGFLVNKQKIINTPLSSPVRVLWKITGKCNLNCRHCWARLCDERSKEELLSLTEQFKDNGVLAVSLSGGEPFLNKHIFEIIKSLKKKNIIVEILTNGTLIDDAVAKKLSEILNLDTDVVQVSLDGSSEATHDKQRTKGSFKLATNGILSLRKYLIPVRSVFVATPINQHDLYNTYMTAIRLGVGVFAPCPVFPLRKGKQFKNMVDGLQYIRQVAACKIAEYSVPTKLRIQVDQTYQRMIHKHFDHIDYKFVKSNRLVSLSETNSSVQIDAYGEMLPGPEWECNLSAGNVYISDFKSIWDTGRNWQEFRKGRDLLNTKCATCKIFEVCEGGNAKLAHDKYGTINMPDGTCHIGEE